MYSKRLDYVIEFYQPSLDSIVNTIGWDLGNHVKNQHTYTFDSYNYINGSSMFVDGFIIDSLVEDKFLVHTSHW